MNNFPFVSKNVNLDTNIVVDNKTVSATAKVNLKWNLNFTLKNEFVDSIKIDIPDQSLDNVEFSYYDEETGEDKTIIQSIKLEKMIHDVNGIGLNQNIYPSSINREGQGYMVYFYGDADSDV